ncbi:cell wall hydrolase [Sphingomonas sp. 37zxx]|uniref:cell wall hydrolase n=1 Tax=Sphingomonas sp. 37zxx TaxID=1550073 RepID=UPI000A8F4834|nr:cell wall hydrolase [Sphingomonas sp. 37zxx]
MNPPPSPKTPIIRAILAVLALLAVLVPAIIVATAPPIMPVERKVARPQPRVIPAAELPPVEPTAFVALDPVDARRFNATVPFSSAPNLPARPFKIAGAPDSIARATDCLTAGVLYESGDDPVGQRAVAQVILNRLRHPAFPKTICGVVFQGAERSTGCQFTFTCDGALARRYADAAWGRAREIAAAALAGQVDKRVGTATHYHTDWVVPYWSSSLDKISEVNTHLFFRWTGWWGTPAAFRGEYAGVEPLIAKLKGIAPAHGAEATTGTPALDVTAIGEADLPAPLAGDADSFVITLDPWIAANDFPAYALRVCGDRPYCKLLGWVDPVDTPKTLPAEPTVMARMAFSYLRDTKGGFEKALWNCERYIRAAPQQCMKRQMLPPPRPEPSVPKSEASPLTGIRRNSEMPAPSQGPALSLPPAKTPATPL